MQKNKRIYYATFPLIASLLVLILTFGFQKNPGFSLKKIHSPLEATSNWNVAPISSEEKDEIRQILDQDFNYLGSGAQCYAFLSADGKYVLKFFKMKHLLPKTWLKFLPVPGLGKYRFNKVDKRIWRQRELFTSYKMAYEELKDETGLVYVHLNKSKDLEMTIHLYDRMRKCYPIVLDDYEFILQKKAQLIRDRITNFMQRGEKEEAVLAIHVLLQQVLHQCQKGFMDRDSGISHNYGFVGDQVIHFDAGRIIRDEMAKDPIYYQREILRIGEKLENWLTIHFPMLVPNLEEVVDSMIDPSS